VPASVNVPLDLLISVLRIYALFPVSVWLPVPSMTRTAVPGVEPVIAMFPFASRVPVFTVLPQLPTAAKVSVPFTVMVVPLAILTVVEIPKSPSPLNVTLLSACEPVMV